MIRVGLVGVGFIGRNHYNQYEQMSDRAKVVAICDKLAKRAAGDWAGIGGNIADRKGTKRDLGDAQPFTDWEQMLAESELDMVDICVPTPMHKEIAIAALEAGKHVLCEKPMALTVTECDEMIDAAAKSPGKFMIAQCIRFWPEYVYLRQVLREKTFGCLTALHLRRHAASPDYTLDRWSIKEDLSGGVVLDLHVHDVDYALQLLGKPKCVFAQGYPCRGGGVTRIHASWQYEADRVVQLESYWDVPELSGFDFNMGFTAVFEEATIHWDSASGRPLTVYRERSEPQVPEIRGRDGYFGEIDYFLTCIERNAEPTVSTPTESRESVAIALAEKQSLRTGQLVVIS